MESIMHTIHIPMPDHLHQALKAEASLTRRPASEIIREALVCWLESVRKRRVADQIRLFAEEVGGSSLDLDQDMERAGIELLHDETEKR